MNVQPARLRNEQRLMGFMLAATDFPPAFAGQRPAGGAQLAAELKVLYVCQDVLIHGASIG